MPKKDFPKTRQHQCVMALPAVKEDASRKETSLPTGDDTLPNSQQSVARDPPKPHAYHTQRMATFLRPLKDVLFEDLRKRLKTEEGRLEATVLAVEKDIINKPIDVHRAMIYLERKGLVDRAADIAFRMGNYPEAIAIYERAGRYGEAGSTAEIAQEYLKAAIFYLRAACIENEFNRGKRYLQRSQDLLAGNTTPLCMPREFQKPSMPLKRSRINARRKTEQTECTSIAAERCGLFREAANFALREGDEQMAAVYHQLSHLVEKLPVK